MIYEAHITVNSDDVIIMGYDTIRLELSDGEHRKQTLIGGKLVADDLAKAKEWLHEFEQVVSARGHKILRSKLEAPLAECKDKFVYAEGHWKFEFKSYKETVEFEKMLAFNRDQLRVSWSLDEPFKVWATGRFHGAPEYALGYMGFQTNYIRRWFPCAHGHFEAVIVDTNPALDNGWF